MEEEKRGKRRRGGKVKANYNYVLSLSSAELGRNLHLARITQEKGKRRDGGKQLLRRDGARERERRGRANDRRVRKNLTQDPNKTA